MATQQDLIDDLRDRLNDGTDSQYPLTTKTRSLNRGMAAMFPKIFQTVRDATTVLATDTFEYALPAAVKKGKLLMVEVETTATSSRFKRLARYEIVPSVTDPLLVLEEANLPSAVGAAIRFTAALPLTAFTSTMGDTYTGPDGTEELPVLYAMGLCTARALDDRMDYQRYSVTNQVSGIDAVDLMTASQFWFAQFEMLLERFQIPLPTSLIGV
jgi:hypothetical protein